MNMKEFKDKVAVITGAAAGIGRGIAQRCVAEGMKVVLAGINLDNLRRVEDELKGEGVVVLSVQTDVSKRDDLELLAEKTLEAFGAVHLLVNNAGVGAGYSIWESSWGDWEWVMGVNLWGVIYGLKIFVPIMLAQDTEGHIVNTASIAGLLPYHPSAPYQVSKHAVVALSEQLYFSLLERKAKVRTSVLCPGWVKTRILESARNRPAAFQGKSHLDMSSSGHKEIIQDLLRALEAGISSEEVADDVFEAIREEKFYILTHDEYDNRIKSRMQAILERGNPTPLS
jgi:NAD(P)-dependent dehydrogenase (short-subunit alcohol dehydrogenase family)